MPDLTQLQAMHFLRPHWLWALIAVVGLTWLLWRRTDATRQWKGVIAPHLLAHLRVGATSRFGIGPVPLLGLGLLLGVLGLAGPTWEQEPSPFAEDTAPLVIALDLSQTMNAVDVAPNRLTRAKMKIWDLLSARSGARTALLVYAGSAHSVIPLSDDASVFKSFLDDLATELMPVPGKEPSQALALAEETLAGDSVPGSILFITDGISEEQTAAFVEHQGRTRDEVMVLAVGTSDGGPIPLEGNRFATDAQGRRIVASLDRAGLDALAREAGIFVGSITVDDADVRRVQARIQTHLESVQQEDSTTRWIDTGYWLVLPLLVLTLFWFRKGWTVRWGFAVLVLAQSGCAPNPAEPFRPADLWLTADQQGRWHWEQGDPATAAESFDDPLWRGVAYYRAGDMQNAVLALARSDAPEAHYNLGNAYAALGDLAAAIASYETALEGRPEWVEAQENLNLVLSLIPVPEEGGETTSPPGPPEFNPNEVQSGEAGQMGEQAEATTELLTDEQIAEMWLRRLQASPADFLRRRFEAEYQNRRSEGRS